MYMQFIGWSMNTGILNVARSGEHQHIHGTGLGPGDGDGGL